MSISFISFSFLYVDPLGPAHRRRPRGKRCMRLALRARYELYQVVGRKLVGEGKDWAVDDEPHRSVWGAPGTGQQVRPLGDKVENRVLVGLSPVQALVDRLLCPLTDLRVPERAVRIRVAWIRQ